MFILWLSRPIYIASIRYYSACARADSRGPFRLGLVRGLPTKWPFRAAPLRRFEYTALGHDNRRASAGF
ncbi:hypothetical protein N7524_006427 [Penicillium chrysogenum]|nr:hypothetical protein N7524_006427 [Penicillium chrysogenum]